jgi:hypothetical protein
LAPDQRGHRPPGPGSARLPTLSIRLCPNHIGLTHRIKERQQMFFTKLAAGAAAGAMIALPTLPFC